MEYPQSETGEMLLDASTIPKGDDEARDELTGDVIHYGWMPHNASFGFLDIARPTLGQIHF
jgi:hypothetical protein